MIGRPPKSSLPFPEGNSLAELDGVPTCPPELDAIGKKRWKVLVKELAALGVLLKSDRDLMFLYCQAYSEYIACCKMLKDITPGGLGISVKEHDDGKETFYRNPYLETKNAAAAEMQDIGHVLGLSPVARKRLDIAKTKQARKPVASRDRSQGLPPPKTAGKIG